VTSAFANFTEAGVDPQAETLTWGDQTYPNPLRLYPQILGRMLDGKKSLVHGDLHLRNILVDESGQGWLIDFALVKERHNLYDFIKLETYIRQMVLSQPQYDFSFADYLQFEAALLDEAVAVPADRMLRKAYEVIRKVRELAARYVKGNFGEEYWPALFLYSLAMLKYAGNHGAKAARLAFGTAGVMGRVIHLGRPSRKVKPPPQPHLPEKELPPQEDKSPNNIRFHDIFTHFEIGLELLAEHLGKTHPRYGDFLAYEERLKNIIKRSRRFGDTGDRQADRAEVIDQLNELALSVLGISFNDLCKS
jgi:hypothetical protein